LAATACTVQPQDPFVLAERAAARRDLITALQALDSVPVAHPRYPAARAMALDVERQMRRGHELILEGLMLRAEWRDDEALVVLRRAASMWPELPGVGVLVRATEQRLQVLGAAATASATAPSPDGTVESTPMPQLELRPGSAAAPAGEPALPPVVPTATATPLGVSSGPQSRMPASADPVAAGLVAVEQRLGANQLEEAVLHLLELARRFPDDTRVRLRLARLLHQRALLRYGRGELAPAIADWRRVVEIEPTNESAKAMLTAAETESNRSRG
jgi:tetratricopeptide (TPR) repeat protein